MVDESTELNWSIAVGEHTSMAMPNIKHLDDALYCNGSSLFEAPKLEYIDGAIHIGYKAKADLPMLRTTSRIYIARSGALIAPQLTEVRLTVHLQKDALLYAPLLKNADVYTEIAYAYYTLYRSDKGMYIAGCRGPWTAEQALDHWSNRLGGCEERSALFVEAVKKAEGIS
jgi:hypothetical protein